MKLIEYLQSRPAILLTLIAAAIAICIIIMIAIMLLRLDNEKKVTKAALELKKITNSIRAGLVHFVLEDQCRILYASKGFYELLGYDKEELKSQNKNSLLDFIHPKDLAVFTDNKELLTTDIINCEVRMVTKSGSSLFVLMSGNGTTSRDGKHTMSVVFVDISEQKRMQERILLEGERYRIAAELSKDILFEYLIDKDQMVFSDKYKEAFNLEPMIPNLVTNSQNRRDYIHPDDWGIYLELLEELAAGKGIIEAEFRIRDRFGEFVWSQLMGKTIYDDDRKPVRVIGKIVNVDIQKRELEALEYKATRDPLTGVYNKEVTIKKIDKYISGNKNNKHMLMFIDFDDFKKVNDSYGHLIGDKILIYITSRIRDVFSEGEIIGRIGGDEFVVFSGNITDIDDVLKKAETLVKVLDTVYSNQGYSIAISGSIGIAIYPEDGLHYEQLLDRADQALYQVKEHGKHNYMIYNKLSDLNK